MADDAASPSGESVEPESQAVEVEPSEEPGGAESADYDEAVVDEETGDPVVAAVAETKPGLSHVHLAMIVGLVAVVALAGLTGWLGYCAHQAKAAADQRNLFLEVGRQGAINLTTLDFEHIDGDVQRIIDSATGAFYDDFQKRSASFTEVVKQAKSKSVGTVTEAGIVEPSTPTEAQVLVAIRVKSQIGGQPEQPIRSLRMRISVEKTDADTKISNVEFVP